MALFPIPLTKNHQIILSADARLSRPDYLNDSTWQINPGVGDPAALSLDSTLGLQVKQARIFPRFFHRNNIITDPARFAQGVQLGQVLSNYASITYHGLPGISVTQEVWVASSHTLAGKMWMENINVLPDSFWLEWDCVVEPLSDGKAMEFHKESNLTRLHGTSSEMDLVFHLGGSPSAGKGPYSGLGMPIELEPGAMRCLVWGFASANGLDQATSRVLQALEQIDAETTRLQIINQRDAVIVEMGDQNNDLAIMLSHRTAQRLMHASNTLLPNASFVTNRKPDLGNSIRGDGTDYPPSWSGQTALDAYLMAQHLLPSQVETAQGLLDNFLSVQAEDGFIDWRPGMGGQRSKRLAQPMLASLTWSIYRTQQETGLLARCLAPLVKFIKCWFHPERDRDGDGYPEWDNPLQAGMEDNPLFDRFTKDSQGADIQRVESPSLAAMLFREIRILLRAAEITGQTEDVTWLTERAGALQQAVMATWDARERSYRYRDYTTHKSNPAEYLHQVRENGNHYLDKKLKQPARLLLRFSTQDELTRPMRITLTGEDRSGVFSEAVPPYEFYWIHGQGRYTTHRVYNRLIRVEVNGMAAGDHGDITTIDLTQQDISLLLPVWAGMAPAEHVKEIVEKRFSNLVHAFGIPVCPPMRTGFRQSGLEMVYPHWNLLVAEGLVRYGYRKEAASLVERLMRAVSASTRNTLGLHESYHCDNGKPEGECDTLRGLIPTNTLLSVLGVTFMGRDKVLIRDTNPFSQPVTVQYSGMTVTRENDNTCVTFSGGQSVVVPGTGAQLVSLS